MGLPVGTLLRHSSTVDVRVLSSTVDVRVLSSKPSLVWTTVEPEVEGQGLTLLLFKDNKNGGSDTSKQCRADRLITSEGHPK